jgi:hypothetical protein
MLALWSHATDEHGFACLPIDRTPSKQAVIELCGEDTTGKQAIAASVCNALGLHLNRIYCSVLPTIQKELTVMLSLWEREAALHREVLLLDCSEYKADDTVRGIAIMHVMQHLRTPLIIVSREQLSFSALDRPVLTLNVAKPALSEQRALWQQALAGCDLDRHIDRLVAQFHLSAATIQSTVATVLAADQQPTTQDEAGSLLWDTCRNHARPVLDELAQRIEPRASWHDLVLPETHQQLLQEIIAQVQQRTTVYETWNFRPAGVHGVGVSALFAGPSGTGKTLAAEVIAHMLQLDLYRVDLSAVVSKYIGETEKNLRRIFDAAEEGGVVLLFDEADALFGKRGEVKDSHDRYANIEVSYLLQRMEAYRGLAILTTNFKHALDAAFLRRIRFVIHFPFPDVAQRTEIWRRIFPASLPTSGLDIHKLARLNIAGGNIRNIAFNAAFLAAAAGESLQMKHLLRATYIEYAKLEKLLTDVEIGGWLCSAMSTVE